MTTKDRMAPGHVYQPQLGSGIEWRPGDVVLREKGEIVETARHETASPYEFWRDLVFADTFPQVTHWWFRSGWTQRVRLTGSQGLMDGSTIWGYIQFVSADVPARMWTISEGERPEISVPFPPNEIQPLNLPLRLALARLVAGVVSDQVRRDTWMVVTSLVQRDELAQTFPDAPDAIPWQLEGIDGSMREALCHLQGLKKPKIEK